MRIYDLEAKAKEALAKAIAARDEAINKLRALKSQLEDAKLVLDCDASRPALLERRAQILQELEAAEMEWKNKRKPLAEELVALDVTLRSMKNPDKELKQAYTEALRESGNAKRALIQMQNSVVPVFNQAMAVRCGNPVETPITEWIDPSAPKAEQA